MKRLFLTFSILTALFSVPAASAQQITFPDIVESEFYQDAIAFLSTEGIVKGNADGTFKPQATLNRAEMVKIIVEATIKLELETQASVDAYAGKTCFEDVPSDAWYTKYVCFAQAKEWVKGYANGTLFKPAQEVNFVEALKITQKAFKKSFTEDNVLWYRDLVEKAADQNLIPLTITGFGKALKRNEMADLVTRYIKYERGQLEVYLGDRGYVAVTFTTILRGEDLSKGYGLDRDQITLDLDAQNSSGQSGTATISEVGDRVKVVVDILEPTDENAKETAQPAHIHAGACPAPGDVKYALNNVMNGKSTTVLDVSLDELIDQFPLAINVHKSSEESSVYVSCGNLADNREENDDEDKDADKLLFKLGEQNDSDQSGVAILQADGDMIKVTIKIDEPNEDVAQPSHIHVGSCAEPGAVKFSLNNLINGRSVTTIDTTFDELFDELPLMINVHKSEADFGTYVSCGDLSDRSDNEEDEDEDDDDDDDDSDNNNGGGNGY